MGFYFCLHGLEFLDEDANHIGLYSSPDRH